MTSRGTGCTVVAVLLLLWSVFSPSPVASVSRHPVLVVVSFDGFRPDYVRPDVTPHLARFRDAGAAPPYMRNAFPTKTFVNHFTMATGLHPESHGVLDNDMFDERGDRMHYTYEQFHYRDGAVVPIWMQNEYSGDERYSGVMMWTAGEFPFQGKTPTYFQKFNQSKQWTDRVDIAISWIKDEKKPANLVMMYFEEPDFTGHSKGVGSQEIKNQIVRVDTTVKYMLDKLKNENLGDKVNLIILSDHGMETVTFDKFIYLDRYVANDTRKMIKTGPNAFVRPNAGKYDEIYTNLTKAAKMSGNFFVYKQDELPDRWHMKNTPRLSGIIYLLAKPGYAFWDDYYLRVLNQTTPEKMRIGTHGYDNEDPSMRAMFMASGPMFKKMFVALPFDNVDLWPLMSRMMGLKELPAGKMRPNGTMAGVEQLLLPDSGSGAAPTSPSPQRARGILLAVALLLHAATRCL